MRHCVIKNSLIKSRTAVAECVEIQNQRARNPYRSIGEAASIRADASSVGQDAGNAVP